jgi:hypothetical protein
MVKETTATTGVGPVTLAGASAGYRPFSDVCVNGDTFAYSIRRQTPGEWETGIGTWGTGGIVTRTTVIRSSNANAAVNFSAGIKDIYITVIDRQARILTPNWHPDIPPLVPNAADDEFDGPATDTAGTRYPGAATPWAWVNQSTATAVQDRGHMIMTVPSSASDTLRYLKQAIGAGSTWKYRCKLSTQFSATQSGYYNVQMAVRNTTSGKLMAIGRGLSSSGTVSLRLFATKWTSVTAWSSDPLNSDIFSGVVQDRTARYPIYLEIEQTATQLIFRYSDVGVDGSFIDYFTENLSTFIVSVQEIGLGIDAANSAIGTGVWDWFRRVA